MFSFHEIEIRVRYQETDAQGRVHHANYLTYFEQGRVELLRACGLSYKELEESGTLLVVAEAQVEYFQGACYDDVLRLQTTTVRSKGARLEHRYELFRGDALLVRGRTIIASVDRTGRVVRLPEFLRTLPTAGEQSAD